MRFYFDLETTGLLRQPDLRIHCMGWAVDDGPVTLTVGHDEVVAVLQGVLENRPDEGNSYLIAHNLMGFDLPILKRFTGLDPKALGWMNHDTKVVGSLVDPEFSGTHSLADWGIRVKAPKDDYKERCIAKGIDPWAAYNEDMGLYCKQDVVTLRKIDLYQREKYLNDYDWTQSLALEHAIAGIMAEQEYTGVYFDRVAANSLEAQMIQKIADLTDTCTKLVKPKCVQGDEVKATFKKNGQPSAIAIKALGLDPELSKGEMIAGPFSRVSFSEYDLDSRHQVIQLLQLHGWKPTEWTDKGNPKFTEDSITSQLGGVGKDLAERFVCITRLGALRNWMKAVRDDERISAKAFSQATPTGRMRHSVVVNVPRPGTAWGKEMRALFGAKPGMELTGCDAAGLELRMLAHYMGDPEYTRQILEGDIHWYNVQLMGLVPKGTARDKDGPQHVLHDLFRNVAKTFIYALIYGAGDGKIGTIVAGLPGWSGSEADGALLRGRFMKGLPKYEALMERIAKGSKKKWLLGIDGRKLYIRHEHAGLNLLMQSAGSILVKAATIYAREQIRKKKIPARQVLHMHDEAQYEHRVGVGPLVAKAFDDGIRWAEKHFKIRCPLGSDSKTGQTWADTH